MENYVKVFELFDKRNSVFKNASVDKIEGQSKQPYTQTINYFFTFDEAKKKISSIWNFSTPELNKRIDKEISPSLIRKFGDKVKDKLGLSKEREIKIKSLNSLGISENKVNNQLFHYTYKGLRIAKIEFDRTKVHNRSWKLIFYYYEGVNDESIKKTDTIPSKEFNKEKNTDTNPNKEFNKDKNTDTIPSEEKKDIVVPFIDSSKKALDFIKKHLDYIYKTSNKEFEIGDMKVLKDSDKEFKIKTNNRTIEVKDPVILKGLNYAFNYQKPSDAKQLGNGESQEEPTTDTKANKEETPNQKQITDKSKVDSFNDFKKKNTTENKLLDELTEIKKDIDSKDLKKIRNSYRQLLHPDKLGKVVEVKDDKGRNTTKREYSNLDKEIIEIYKETEEILGNKQLSDSDKKNRIKGDLNKIIKLIEEEIKKEVE